MDLQARWERAYRRHIGRPSYLNLTPVQATLSQELTGAIRRHVSGRVLDAGAGDLTYAFLLAPAAREYVTIDIESRPRLTARADVCRLPFAGGTFDTVFSTQVLEHVTRPQAAMKEFARVLRPGGTLLLTVPHLAYQHGIPHDYYRFTEFGLAHLAAEAGLQVREMRPAGGFLCFAAEPCSILLHALFGTVPVLSWPAAALNALFVRAAVGLDRLFGRRRLYAVNWIAVFTNEGCTSGRTPEEKRA